MFLSIVTFVFVPGCLSLQLDQRGGEAWGNWMALMDQVNNHSLWNAPAGSAAAAGEAPLNGRLEGRRYRRRKVRGELPQKNRSQWEDVVQQMGKLDLPAGKHRLYIDVGLETGSALACMLEENPDMVVLAFEALPKNFVESYRTTMQSIPEHVRSRIRVLPFAVSDTNGMVTFNEAFAPACGSILPSKPDAWWCGKTTHSLTVPAVRLDLIMEVVPQEYELEYVKVDIEGADLMALKGLGNHLDGVASVAFECPTKDHQNNAREGNCVQDDAKTYLATKGFKSIVCDETDCFAGWKHEEDAHRAKCLHEHFGHIVFKSCGGKGASGACDAVHTIGWSLQEHR